MGTEAQPPRRHSLSEAGAIEQTDHRLAWWNGLNAKFSILYLEVIYEPQMRVCHNNRPRGAKDTDMKKIFTKRFLELSAGDQAGIVDAALQDLNQCWVSEEDRKRAERMRKRIAKKAVECGVWEEVK